MAQAPKPKAKPKPKSKPKYSDKEQSERFIEAARKLDIVEAGHKFDEALNRLLKEKRRSS